VVECRNQQNLAAELAEEFGDDIEVTWSQGTPQYLAISIRSSAKPHPQTHISESPRLSYGFSLNIRLGYHWEL
jgi:hypothetical protein